MTAPETAPETAVEVLQPEPAPPSPWPLAEETLAANEAWKAMWAEPVEIPPLPSYCDGPAWDACIPATRQECNDFVDALSVGYGASPERKADWYLERERGTGRARDTTADSHGPMSGYETPVPRFIPSDETASDLPVVGDDTEAMTRYLGLHDGRQDEPAREPGFVRRWFR